LNAEANIEYKNSHFTGTLCQFPHNNLLELVELEANIEYKNALLTGTLCDYRHNNLLELAHLEGGGVRGDLGYPAKLILFGGLSFYPTTLSFSH